MPDPWKDPKLRLKTVVALNAGKAALDAVREGKGPEDAVMEALESLEESKQGVEARLLARLLLRMAVEAHRVLRINYQGELLDPETGEVLA